MTKNRRKTIIRFLLLVSTIVSLFFVPWILVKAWILPLPHTVQEQVDEAISHGFDGIIVYVDKAGKPPAFFTAGWKDRDNKIIEGNSNKIKTVTDYWKFSKETLSEDPNWFLSEIISK